MTYKIDAENWCRLFGKQAGKLKAVEAEVERLNNGWKEANMANLSYAAELGELDVIKAERDKYRQGCKDRDVVLDEVVVLLNHCRAMEDGPYPEEVSEILSRRPEKEKNDE